MSASSSDYFMKVGRATATTLSSPGYTIGDTSINVASTTNWPTDTGVTFAIDVVGSDGLRVSGSYNVFRGVVSSATQVSSVTYVGGDANRNYSAGATTRVYILVSSYRDNRFTDGILEEHKQDGTHDNTIVGLLAGTQTFTGNKTFSGVTTANILKFNAPQGFLINGKISRTVASNDITVAIKTLAGNDPSASDPVYVRIGDTIRSITAACTVTKNDGTNWFGKGASYFAANESDYFVYLCWNTTDSAVTIAFSSTPACVTYADFSTTNTNWNYWAGSGSAPASTDEVEVVGRFNATLSASASYNWSVPATSIVINRPIFETRAFSFTNTGSAGGTFYYQQVGLIKRVWGVSGSISTSTVTTNVILTYPVGFFTAVRACLGATQSVASVAQQFFVGNGAVGVTQHAFYIFCQSGTGTATAALEIIGV